MRFQTLLLLMCMLLSSCNQEKMIFYPESLQKDYVFKFKNEFEEIFIEVEDKTKIHGLLFTNDSSKGLVFYLHGNSGSNRTWGNIADLYLQNEHDIFIIDYRGYGKSDGRITSEKQFYSDLQIVYDSLKQRYNESTISIIGYSIGTGPAAKLSASNNPKLLILKAPYYNLPDMARNYVLFAPSFTFKYKFNTNEFLPNVKCPIIIFHGDADEIIDFSSSLKLQKLFKPGDRLIRLRGEKHNGINDNSIYQNELREML